MIEALTSDEQPHPIIPSMPRFFRVISLAILTIAIVATEVFDHSFVRHT